MSMMMSHLIDDGYDYPGFLADRPGVHPALRFRYRPALAEEREDLTRVVGRSFILDTCDFLAKKIVSWEVRDRRGEVKPVSSDILRKVQPDLLQAIIGVVLGWRASDPDPSDAGQRMEAKTPNAERLLESEKNSGGASA